MTNRDPGKRDSARGRRRTLKVIGGSALTLLIGGVSSCSDDDSSSDQVSSGGTDRASGSPGTTAESIPAALDDSVTGADLSRLDQSLPQAQAFAYVNDAATVDSAAQPAYQAGQACANCSLFQGDDGDEWGPCSIFPGRAVNAAGWCMVYAPKA